MHILTSAQRIIIKVGSSLIAHKEQGKARHYWMAGLAQDIAALRRDGKEVVIVTSGAVALGRGILGFDAKPLTLVDKQAAAACGQFLLMHEWQNVFAEDGIKVAQLLLTLDDSESRKRYLNARTTLNALLAHGVIPIVNENDTVATAELRVGDNDRLAARVAQMISADVLILLSDIDGLYTADPSKNPEARFIADVPHITEQICNYAAPPSSRVGTGGMITKIEAAMMATSSGCHMILAQGAIHRPINALHAGGKHTLFHAQTSPLKARKEWIAGVFSPSGMLVIDEGACAALQRGTSLLPVGVVEVRGTFQRGDVVMVVRSFTGNVIAKGLVCYPDHEMRAIVGMQSAQIVEALGYERGDVAIHRDDLVMMI
ncbi:MAG: glutamate 5-kinase [Alphaproteobacteria bacterium]|nr:MAG: glutamate 5-kinase [Alphaproteobacteria bacterium]TAF14493.1 MAG: glutamate 5-kinase [Alphaproteobacteria bacterium]TAF76065.1 MAG: glutamate 5-kinase [Alphaproteobacteria bacterium]